MWVKKIKDRPMQYQPKDKSKQERHKGDIPRWNKNNDHKGIPGKRGEE